jgi:hypothetical protein
MPDDLATLSSEHARAAWTTRNKSYPRCGGYLRVDKDFYVEPPWVVHLLLDVETFIGLVHVQSRLSAGSAG